MGELEPLVGEVTVISEDVAGSRLTSRCLDVGDGLRYGVFEQIRSETIQRPTFVSLRHHEWNQRASLTHGVDPMIEGREGQVDQLLRVLVPHRAERTPSPVSDGRGRGYEWPPACPPLCPTGEELARTGDVRCRMRLRLSRDYGGLSYRIRRLHRQ
jgi:hypothetical protein